MNKINKKLEYALMALCHLKKAKGLVSAKEISGNYGVSFDVMARVLQQLASGGFVNVTHGVTGGYSLSPRVAHSTLHDLIEQVLGPLGIARCLHEEGCEIFASCNIASPMENLNRKLMGFYKSQKLMEIIEG